MRQTINGRVHKCQRLTFIIIYRKQDGKYNFKRPHRPLAHSRSPSRNIIVYSLDGQRIIGYSAKFSIKMSLLCKKTYGKIRFPFAIFAFVFYLFFFFFTICTPTTPVTKDRLSVRYFRDPRDRGVKFN